MTIEEFNEKNKEYNKAMEEDNSDQYYNENKKLCHFMSEIWNIDLALEDSFSIIVDDGMDLSLDDEAEEAIQQILIKRKNRMIECFTL